MGDLEWEALKAARADAFEESLDKGATRSVWLGIAAWMLTPCCFAGAANGSDTSNLQGKPREFVLGYMGAKLAVMSIPAILAATGLVLAVMHLRTRTKRRVEAWLGIVFTGGYLLLCGGGVGIGVLQGMGVGPFAPKARIPGPPLTQAEVSEFGDRVVAALERRDLKPLDDRVDLDGLIQRGHPNGPVPRGVRKGAEEAIRENGGLLTSMVGPHLDGASYVLIHAEATPEPVLVFRLLPRDGGVNYHVMHLCRGEDGQPSIDDLYVPLLGFRLSSVYADLGPTAVARNKGVAEMSRLIQAGRFAEAIAVHGKLPQEQRQHHQLLLLRYTAAQKSEDPAAIDAAIDDMERHLLPDHPGVVFVLFDRDLERGDFDRCLEAVAAVERAVGTDPYLEIIRANVHVQRGDAKQALACATRACDGIPTAEEAWAALGNAAVGAGDAPAIRRAMEQLVVRFRYAPAEVEANFDLSGFRASPEAAAWETWKQERGAEPR